MDDLGTVRLQPTWKDWASRQYLQPQALLILLEIESTVLDMGVCLLSKLQSPSQLGLSKHTLFLFLDVETTEMPSDFLFSFHFPNKRSRSLAVHQPETLILAWLAQTPRRQ